MAHDRPSSPQGTGERAWGLAAGAAAYGVWGLFPIYFKALASVTALEILAHRVVWALLFLLVLVRGQNLGASLWAALRRGRSLSVLGASASLLAVNWLVYIYSVLTGRILESSLGYFVTPLVSVLLGILVLEERLKLPIVVAAGVAGAGVLWLTVEAGGLPWIAIVLAGSWGCYGMLRKIAPVGSVVGVTIETLLLFPLASGYLAWSRHAGTLAFRSGPGARDLLLVLSGPITAVPLLLFTAAARRLPLSMLGFLQYLSPTIQFVLAVLVYGEPFSPARAVGFGFIWAALAVFLTHSVREASGS